MAIKAFGGGRNSEIEVATTVSAHHSKRDDFESDTFVVDVFQNTGQGWWNNDPIAQTLRDSSAGGDSSHANLVAHALTGEGFDASEDGTGCGTPLVAVPLLAVAFSCKDYGADAGEVSPTLRAMEFDGSHANGGGQIAVAFTKRTRADGRNLETQEELAYALCNPGSGGRTHSRSILQNTGVRRLMPVECERLQGFPDGFTNITYRGKPAADGPRYRALGNSMAVPVIRWILNRIIEADEGCRK